MSKAIRSLPIPVLGVGTVLVAALLVLPLVAAPAAPVRQSASGPRFQIAALDTGLYFLDTTSGELWASAPVEGLPYRVKWVKLNTPLDK